MDRKQEQSGNVGGFQLYISESFIQSAVAAVYLFGWIVLLILREKFSEWVLIAYSMSGFLVTQANSKKSMKALALEYSGRLLEKIEAWLISVDQPELPEIEVPRAEDSKK